MAYPELIRLHDPECDTECEGECRGYLRRLTDLYVSTKAQLAEAVRKRDEGQKVWICQSCRYVSGLSAVADRGYLCPACHETDLERDLAAARQRIGEAEAIISGFCESVLNRAAVDWDQMRKAETKGQAFLRAALAHEVARLLTSLRRGDVEAEEGEGRDAQQRAAGRGEAVALATQAVCADCFGVKDGQIAKAEKIQERWVHHHDGELFDCDASLIWRAIEKAGWV